MNFLPQVWIFRSMVPPLLTFPSFPDLSNLDNTFTQMFQQRTQSARRERDEFLCKFSALTPWCHCLLMLALDLSGEIRLIHFLPSTSDTLAAKHITSDHIGPDSSL